VSACLTGQLRRRRHLDWSCGAACRTGCRLFTSPSWLFRGCGDALAGNSKLVAAASERMHACSTLGASPPRGGRGTASARAANRYAGASKPLISSIHTRTHAESPIACRRRFAPRATCSSAVLCCAKIAGWLSRGGRRCSWTTARLSLAPYCGIAGTLRPGRTGKAGHKRPPPVAYISYQGVCIHESLLKTDSHLSADPANASTWGWVGLGGM